MSVEEQLFFHRTGSRVGARLGPAKDLQPALFARLRDLGQIRYDFPLVLLASDGDAPFVTTLSGVVDDLLGEVAPRGLAGERLRRGVLRLERLIRGSIDAGERGTLGELWDACASTLVLRGGQPMAEDLAKARAALRIDGDLLAFDATVASRYVTHVWRAVQDRKARALRRTLDTLAQRLADLVKADHLRSAAGRHADTLRAGVGAAHKELFDFDLMASLLSTPSGASALSPRRRARIEQALGVIRAQRFYGPAAYDFEFARVDAALQAYRDRGANAAALLCAIAIAELELRGSYVEAKHDEYFECFDTSSVSSEDLGLFPDYLVRIAPGAVDAEDRTRLLEALTSGAPLKILFETADAFGLGAQLATTAMGLGDAFVLQSSAARFCAVRDRVHQAMTFSGPALLSIFNGGRIDGAAPRYLVAAAATEARAFPTFSYDPARGADWAQRLALHDDPQPDRIWPEHELSFAGQGSRHESERVAFTFADLAITDPAQAGHFARVTPADWNDRLVPLAGWLEDARPQDVPFVYAIDPDAGLCKLVVDQRLAESTRRCADGWRRLRELDALKQERVAAAAAPVPEPVAVAAASAPAAEPSPETAGVTTGASSDEPYIETPRCTTCNECTTLNPRMFGYNENKQAFIKDPTAGTFRELVEAAEGCQVAIIHPGRPRDPHEPGLEELIQRAASFQ